MAKSALVRAERIERAILLLRGHRVLLDTDLAELYQVETRSLNQAVKRNLERFPADFMFRLTRQEVELLNRSQTVIGSQRHRDPRYPPYAFSQEGVAMLSSVLRSRRAVAVNVEIMRTFVRLRGLLPADPDLARRIAELEGSSKRHDAQFQAVFVAIRRLMLPPAKTKPPIGFRPSASRKPEADDAGDEEIGQEAQHIAAPATRRSDRAP